MEINKKHVSYKRMLCISLAITTAVCVWCVETHQGQVATVNVCNPHEIVSGRSGPINSFLAASPVLILPPKGEL